MTVDYFLADPQAQASTFIAFCGKERFEKMCAGMRRHSRPLIRDCQDDAFPP
jgi:hypothetical protein